jgi:hypothetical protein
MPPPPPRWNQQPPLKLKLQPDMAIVPLAPPVSQFWGRAGDRAGVWEHRVNPEYGCAEVRRKEERFILRFRGVRVLTQCCGLVSYSFSNGTPARRTLRVGCGLLGGYRCE